MGKNTIMDKSTSQKNENIIRRYGKMLRVNTETN
jgi:hypothetical protein